MAGHGAIKIFAGNASKQLAQKICDKLGLPLGNMEVGKFSDGEINVNIAETVRGCECFIIQSTEINNLSGFLVDNLQR